MTVQMCICNGHWSLVIYSHLCFVITVVFQTDVQTHINLT